MPLGQLNNEPDENDVDTRSALTLRIVLSPQLATYRLSSASIAIPTGLASPTAEKVVTVPSGVIRLMLFPAMLD